MLPLNPRTHHITELSVSGYQSGEGRSERSSLYPVWFLPPSFTCCPLVSSGILVTCIRLTSRRTCVKKSFKNRCAVQPNYLLPRVLSHRRLCGILYRRLLKNAFLRYGGSMPFFPRMVLVDVFTLSSSSDNSLIRPHLNSTW